MNRTDTSQVSKPQRKTRNGGLRLEPLPWPEPGVTARQTRREHGHRCMACGVEFECSGPDETGYCAPVCSPCYWIELGSQLRLYESMVAELARKRMSIERRIGRAACRMAEMRRRRVVANGNLVAAFGMLVAHHQPQALVLKDEQRGTDIEADSEASPA